MGRAGQRDAALALALWLALAAAGTARASDSLADALGRDSEVTLHFRTYYFDRLNPSPPDDAAWAIGGWVGYRTGWIGDAVKIRVQAPPEKGKANAAVISLLADFLNIPAKRLSICAGHASQNKIVEVQGVSDAELINKLSGLAT